MTTVRSSWRGKPLAALAVGLLALASAPASAHRRDEYLQAARVGIDPGRVLIELDLTPGIEVAQAIVTDIDRDRNGVVAADEAQAYATRVRRDIRLDIDNRPLDVELIGRRFPAVPTQFHCEGTIQLQL